MDARGEEYDEGPICVVRDAGDWRLHVLTRRGRERGRRVGRASTDRRVRRQPEPGAVSGPAMPAIDVQDGELRAAAVRRRRGDEIDREGLRPGGQGAVA